MELDLYSERLHLSPLGEGDADIALEILSDQNVMRYVWGVSDTVLGEQIEIGYLLKPSAWGKGLRARRTHEPGISH
jgi:hypothetical protein